jgi:hypothetical protein
MNLKELKDYIESFPNYTVFKYGLSQPFSWRGSYDEVAFAIILDEMSKEDILNNIEIAYTDVFYGYKGGEYKYDNYTEINFEEKGNGNYTDGVYTSNMIAMLENTKTYKTQENRLVNLLFKK